MQRSKTESSCVTMATGWLLLLLVIMMITGTTAIERSSLQKPRDCYDIFSNHSTCSDGVYTIYINGGKRAVEVYCDMTNDGGGWTVIQRREDGTVDFYRRWNHYKKGFGTLTGEFWLGNDHLHWMTTDNRQRLHIDMDDATGITRYAEYDNFAVGSAKQKYKLNSLGNFSGNAGDSLKPHLGEKFSTPGQDNDSQKKRICTYLCSGAWWYGDCCESNLNGLYFIGKKGRYARRGIEWMTFRGYYYSNRFSEMKIRPFYVH